MKGTNYCITLSSLFSLFRIPPEKSKPTERHPCLNILKGKEKVKLTRSGNQPSILDQLYHNQLTVLMIDASCMEGFICNYEGSIAVDLKTMDTFWAIFLILHSCMSG